MSGLEKWLCRERQHAGGQRRGLGGAIREDADVGSHVGFTDLLLEFIQVNSRCHAHLIERIHVLTSFPMPEGLATLFI